MSREFISTYVLLFHILYTIVDFGMNLLSFSKLTLCVCLYCFIDIKATMSLGIDPVRLSKPPVDLIRKRGAEEFKAIVTDDAERAEFWLDNTIRVFDELSCTPDECLKCAVSLLRDSAYYWWRTLISIVPNERVTWDFFQTEFRKKFISQRFIDRSTLYYDNKATISIAQNPMHTI